MIVVFILGVLVYSNSKAQFVTSVLAGVGGNNAQTNITTEINTKIKTEMGYYISFCAKYRVVKKISVSAAVGLIQKKYSLTRTGASAGIFEKRNNTYLQIPLTADFLIFENKKWQGYLSGGVYAAYWLSAKLKGKVPDIFSVQDSITQSNQTIETFSLVPYNKKYIFNSKKDRRFELGSTINVAAIFSLDKVHKIVTSLSYFQSFSSQQKKFTPMTVPLYNQTFVATIGYVIGCKQRKK